MSDRIPFHEALHAQPTLLGVAAASIESSLSEAGLAPWQPGETVAVVAMGASTNSGYALQAALTGRGVRSANLTASELAAAPASFEPADHLLLVSESGRSPEPIAAARGRGLGRRIAITNFPDAAISEVADFTVGYGGVDDSPVYTSGYIATLMSYAAIMRAVGLDAAFDPASAPSLVQDTIDRTLPEVAGLVHRFDGARSVDLIGRGFGFASAAQGALMLREALRLPATGWETFQYVHGPLEAATQGSVLVVIGDGRELDVVPQLAEAGVQVVVVTASTGFGYEHDRVSTVRTTAPSGFARTIEETVILQLITDEAARHQGVTIEESLYPQPDTKLPEGQPS